MTVEDPNHNCCDACLDCWTGTLFRFERYLAKRFNKWGRFVARHPGFVIIGSLLFAVVTSLFIFNIKDETRTEYLYAPQVKLSFDSVFLFSFFFAY